MEQKQQDTTPETAFLIHLLFEEMTELPDPEKLLESLQNHLGTVEENTHEPTLATYLAKDYIAEINDTYVPVMLSILGCTSMEGLHIDPISRSQMRDCPQHEELLQKAKYHIVATDMMGEAIPDYKTHAELICNYAESLMEVFPKCIGIYFQNTGKLFDAKTFRHMDIGFDNRFIRYVVNFRLFRADNSDNLIVDSLGMNVLELPDVQYHFHGMEPNLVVRHAMNLCSYNFDYQAPIGNNETVDGIEDAHPSSDVQWACQYEESLVQPNRIVLDVRMNEFASDNR
ncbi:MAG: DUF4261 domain-containing protein [Erysipelotrichaceae bacterium]|nr:DUF4261 domain-containing protein [Erysipelotrichaceae bacterium]